MAKFCSNCGHELRDTDKFCSECGAAVGGGAALPGAWEYCEIKLWHKEVIFGEQEMLYAEGSGPYGVRTVARGRTFRSQVTYEWPVQLNDTYKTALSDLVQTLIAEGWEQLPNKGPAPWSFKFRPPFKA